jgi:hypothetical protein
MTIKTTYDMLRARPYIAFSVGEDNVSTHDSIFEYKPLWGLADGRQR